MKDFNEMRIEVPYENPVPNLLNEFFRKTVREEDEALTRGVIEILELRGYTVTKNE